MPTPGLEGKGRGLFEQIERIRLQRRTGLLEFEVRDQLRALPFVGGELHLPSAHPHSERWRELLAAPRTPATLKGIGQLLEQFVDSLRDWGAVREFRFHEGHARLPAELVGPLPTGKLLRVAGARDPRAVEAVAKRFGAQRLVGENPSATGSFAWTPEELWVLERLRQPSTLAELTRESPIPREALLRAVAGLAATGQLRTEGAAPEKSRADELSELAERLAERVGADLARESEARVDRDDFRHRVAALLANTGGLDHYELLGLDHDAGAAEVQSAFEELARLVHPANARRHGVPELSEALRFLFERATDAYQTLTDPQRRMLYRAALQLPETAAAEVDPVERAREVAQLAQRQFERALAEERNGDYHSALVLLEEVVRLAPTVAHWSALARLQEKNPAWSARAIESWRSALALDPQNGAIRLALGEVYERAGDPEQALHCYQSAAGGSTPLAAAAAAVERLRSARSAGDGKESGPRRLGNLFRRV
jgi:tetratricopeptide (TPR) repeat protein